MSDDLPTLTSEREPVQRRAFGFQRSPTHMHQGIDLPAPEGTPVYAAERGRVVHAYNAYHTGFSGYGKVVVVEGDDGYYQLYAHLKRPLVNIGDTVEQGAEIGEVGRTGYTSEDHYRLVTGAHLHFEVSPARYPQKSEAPRVDPVQWLRAGRVHPLKRKRLGGDAPIPEPAPVSEGSSPADRPFVAPAGRGAFLRLSGRCPHCLQSFSCVATADLEPAE